jgi:hypothetical protein
MELIYQVLMSVTYYEYLCGSGSGTDWSIVKLDTSENGAVDIYAKSNWMGSNSNFSFKLIGTYTSVDGPYGVVEIMKAIDLTTSKAYDFTEHIDVITFDEPIQTEFGAGMHVFPCEGFNPVATEKFQLHLTKNKNMYNHEGVNELPVNVIEFINNLKYGLVTEERYNSLKKIFEKEKE